MPVSMISPHGSSVPGLRTMTPPVGVFVFALMPYFLKGQTIHHRSMHRDVINADWIIWERFVQVVAVQQLPLGITVSS